MMWGGRASGHARYAVGVEAVCEGRAEELFVEGHFFLDMEACMQQAAYD